MRKRIAILAALFAAIFTFAIVTPASATSETGHAQTIPVSGGSDLQVRIIWNTAFNAVGTSSTEPMTLQMRQTSSGPFAANDIQSYKVTFRKANGGSPVTKTGNCYLAPFDTTYNSCDLGSWTNIQLVDAPTVVITLYGAVNQAAPKFGPITYQYK